jgi:hypothetical protein
MEEYRGFKSKTTNQEIGELARYERDSGKSEDEKEPEEQQSSRGSGLYTKVNSKLRREALKARLPRGSAPLDAQNTEGSLPSGRVDSIVKAQWRDSETMRHDQKVMAMRARQDREAEALDQIFGDTESGRSGSDQIGPDATQNSSRNPLYRPQDHGASLQSSTKA